MSNPVWSEKYRPLSIKECILPDGLKKTFQDMVDAKHVPDLLLFGPPGVGKTTAAMAMLNELGCDVFLINSSMNGNIDTLRYDILQYASTMSLNGGRKYVILDEADYLNPTSTQPALRNFMQQYSSVCGFILTANYPSKIIEPIRKSRCVEINFAYPKSEAAKLAKEFFARAQNILTLEGIPYDKSVVAQVIQKFYPDWRRVLNELQKYSLSGQIDSGIFVNLSEQNYKELVGHLKANDFTKMRKWVAENIDQDSDVIFRKLYDIVVSSDTFKPGCVPVLVVTLSKYMYQSAFVADKEVNLVACLTEVMVDAEFN